MAEDSSLPVEMECVMELVSDFDEGEGGLSTVVAAGRIGFLDGPERSGLASADFKDALSLSLEEYAEIGARWTRPYSEGLKRRLGALASCTDKVEVSFVARFVVCPIIGIEFDVSAVEDETSSAVSPAVDKGSEWGNAMFVCGSRFECATVGNMAVSSAGP